MLSNYELKKLKEKDKVAYLPPGRLFTDMEIGFISSISKDYIHVKFKKQLDDLGWEGTTSQACKPSHLTWVSKGTYKETSRTNKEINKEIGYNL